MNLDSRRSGRSEPLSARSDEGPRKEVKKDGFRSCFQRVSRHPSGWVGGVYPSSWKRGKPGKHRLKVGCRERLWGICDWFVEGIPVGIF